jgi:ubiquinone/menaquinone biosynthesis C-methylase UbiE
MELKMSDKKFDTKKLEKLNNPQRLQDISPDFIQSKLSMKRPEVLVDLGAGTAFFSIAFLQQFNPLKIYACDMSEVMIDWITENVSPSHPKIIPVKNEESSVPLKDGIADLLFMITLHHELDDPSLMLKEAYRILKPGGEIFIVDWKKVEMPQGPPAEIRCLPEQVKEELTASGFSGAIIFNDLPKHFLVVGKKNHQCA